MLTQAQIVSALQAVGVAAGDRLLVHSSMRALGPVVDGATTVLAALLEVLGPAGLLVMPTFHYQIPEPCYDPGQTPSRTGVLTQQLWQHPLARRSLHPTHSVAAIGYDAAAFTDRHLGSACGVGSPLDRLAQAGGKVLLLGVTHTSNTTIHVGEAHAGLRKFPAWTGPAPVARVRLPDGQLLETTLDTSSSCSAAFNALDLPLRRRGAIRDFRLGLAPCMLLNGLDIIAATVALTRAEPSILTYTRPDCRRCQDQQAYYRSVQS